VEFSVNSNKQFNYYNLLREDSLTDPDRVTLELRLFQATRDTPLLRQYSQAYFGIKYGPWCHNS